MSLTDTVSAAGLSIYAEAGLILFLAAFLAIVFQLTRHSVSKELLEQSVLPFDDSDEGRERVTAHDSPEAIRHGK